MIFRRLFPGRADKDPPRRIESAWELRPGDFLKLGFVAPEGLSQAELQISNVSAVDLGGAHKVRRVLTLETRAGERFGMWHGEGNRLALAREVPRAVVEQLFDLEEFARLFDPDEPPTLVLERIGQPPGLEGWTAPLYRQEGALQAYLHPADPAVTKIDEILTGDAEGFDHFRLVGDDRDHVLEVAVFDGGRTEVTLIALSPTSIVEEMWPA